MPLSEVTLSAKLFSTNSYTLVKLLMLVLRSSSGPLEAAETPVTPGPNTPPRTEQRTMTKAAKRTDRTQRGINTSHFQYSGVFDRLPRPGSGCRPGCGPRRCEPSGATRLRLLPPSPACAAIRPAGAPDRSRTPG